MQHARVLMMLASVLSLAGCAAAPELPPVQPYDAASLAATRYKAVLVAGDSHLPVFDNAVAGVAARLRGDEVLPDGVTRLSAAPAVIALDGVRSASLDHVLDAIRTMQPSPGQGCFVFATSHGAAHRGLALSATGEILNPAALDRALASGCGNAPTVVVASGCFTGSFAQAPMARPNRVIITAARPDRTSFGCGAGYDYTVFDKCLLGAMDAGGTWRDAFTGLQQCVAVEERKGKFRPSEPQAYFGSAVADMPVPVAGNRPRT